MASPNFPSRKPDAISGSQFIKVIEGFKSGSPKRNELIINELKNGNMPSFNRKFIPITINEGNINLTYYVSPDYVCIGSDSDYIRISCDGPTSQRIADLFGCILPTKKMVDQIYKQAKTKATPAPMSGGATVSGKKYTGKEFINQKMQHADSLEEHNRMIERQLSRVKHNPGDLVAGIKKDVVIGNKLSNKPDRVNIYGWHLKGNPIQPESTFHEASYYDYSHAVRLIYNQCELNGKITSLSNILKDNSLFKLVSYEKLFSTSYNTKPKEDKNTPIETTQNTTELQNANGEFIRLKGRVPVEVAQKAKSLLGMEMGKFHIETINNITYKFVAEPHYHPPGFKGGPIGWHKGISVFMKNTKDPKEIASNKPIVKSPELSSNNTLHQKIDSFLKSII